jgi:hypothetical protein
VEHAAWPDGRTVLGTEYSQLSGESSYVATVVLLFTVTVLAHHAQQSDQVIYIKYVDVPLKRQNCIVHINIQEHILSLDSLSF